MKFITEINIPEFPFKMDYSKKMMLLGSCFTENIGAKLSDMKFSLDINPFGIQYNPESIAQSLKIILRKRLFTESDLFHDKGLWSSYFHHGRFSGTERNKVLSEINERIINAHEFLKNTDFLVITFGTAWVYELKKTGLIVSNCHKVNASEFKRFRLGVYEITETYKSIIEDILEINPEIKIIFTVSPIRHLKDGAIENQLSKATLLLAIDKLKISFRDNICNYFPAYEIMMDELRDYRFYASDMIHIGDTAVDYIFKRFSDSFISKESLKMSEKILRIKKMMNHRPINKHSGEYETFIPNNLNEIEKLSSEFRSINFDDEKTHFEIELKNLNENKN